MSGNHREDRAAPGDLLNPFSHRYQGIGTSLVQPLDEPPY